MLDAQGKKLLISALSACLLLVIVLFLYTTYSIIPAETASSNPSANADLSSSSQNLANKQSNAQVDKPSSQVSESIEQPDKSLPIPGHQLKKLISNTNTESQASLEEKIASANKAIEQLEQQLPEQLVADVSVDQTSAENLNSNNNSDIEARIQHIRDHLDKNTAQ